MSNTLNPGPQIAHVGGINLGTRNLESSLWFFRDVLGMEEVANDGRVAYLRCFQELAHHSLVLTEQSEAVVNSYSFRTRRKEDVELFSEEFTNAGVEVVELPSNHEAGRGEAIRFLLPGGGHPFELYYDIEKPVAPEALRSRLPSNSSRRRGLGVRRIDHFNIQTASNSINEAERWVREHLGFKRREFARLADSDTLLASWMSVTPQMHDLAIVANSMEKKAQLHHVAFNIENFSDSLVAADTLRDLDVSFGAGPGKHGIGQAMYLYVHDPGSDHRIELYSGGYLIFDPDWQALEWKPVDFPEGLTWFGDPIDTTPGSRGRDTTDSAPLRPVIRSI